MGIGDCCYCGEGWVSPCRHRHTTPSPRPARPAALTPGRSGFSQRDIDGLILVGEHYGAPYDLLAAALRVHLDRLPALAARWRRAGYAATGSGWCWLTRDGMTATGLGFPATRPALGRLAHNARSWPAGSGCRPAPAWHDGQAWWHSERRLRASHPAAGRRGHVQDAEIHWPSIETSPCFATPSRVIDAWLGSPWVASPSTQSSSISSSMPVYPGAFSQDRYNRR